ncbi:MAG: Fur family transcriptional regulator [Actinomycetota bacterium]
MDLEKRLKTRGYRMTPQRRSIYEVLEENEGYPLCPEDIHFLGRDKLPELGLTTVYRTMELFTELGIALPVHMHEESQYYEVNSGGHHHHMVCISCGSVEIIEACLIGELKELIRDDSDFLVTSHCMSLFGYCKHCQRERENRDKAEPLERASS